MFRKQILPAFLLFTLAACNLVFTPRTNEPISGPIIDPQLQIDQAVTQTFFAQTQIALSVQQTMAMMATDTPSLTPSVTLPLTPEKVMVSVSVETNCRSGPGQVYDYLGGLMIGETGEIFARDPTERYWYIRNPDATGFCWIWGEYATVTGITSSLPIYTPEPTPTPASTFTFSYRFWGVGPGFECLLFDVTNTGSTTWESYSISIHDITHGDTGIGSGNEFINYDNWCFPTVTLLDLTPGETGTASGIMHMIHDASGDHFEATLKVCSQNGLAGDCRVRTITFIF